MTKRIRTGTAACVIAAAAIFTPAAVANAEPAAPIPTTGIGAAAVPDCVLDPATACPPSLSPFASSLPSASSLSSISSLIPSSIFQNPLWWFGTPNPTPPTQTPVFQFYPLALIPGFLQPLFGWFGNINFEFCIAGLTLQIGPYGTVSGSYSRGCA